MAASDEPRPGEPFTPTPFTSPLRHRCRNIDTDYDELLMSGVDRDTPRSQVRHHVEEVLGHLA